MHGSPINFNQEGLYNFKQKGLPTKGYEHLEQNTRRFELVVQMSVFHPCNCQGRRHQCPTAYSSNTVSAYSTLHEKEPGLTKPISPKRLTKPLTKPASPTVCKCFCPTRFLLRYSYPEASTTIFTIDMRQISVLVKVNRFANKTWLPRPSLGKGCRK